MWVGPGAKGGLSCMVRSRGAGGPSSHRHSPGAGLCCRVPVSTGRSTLVSLLRLHTEQSSFRRGLLRSPTGLSSLTAWAFTAPAFLTPEASARALNRDGVPQHPWGATIAADRGLRHSRLSRHTPSSGTLG